MSYFSKNIYVSKSGPSPFGKTFLTGGLLCTLFGIAILIQPDLIAYLVATFFLVIGLSLLGTWWKMRQ